MTTVDLGGGVRLYPVVDGWARMEAREAFGDQTDSVLAAHPQHFDDGTFEFPLGAFLLRNGDRTTLIDAGAGPRDSWAQSGALLDNLARLDVTPADIDDVVYTHLHWDHIGWASQKGRVIFPKATHHCHEADWAHFYGPQPGATKRLAPVADRMRLWSHDGPLLPGLDVMHAPGHTPGSSVVVVSGPRSRVALLGDVVHCPFQLTESEWEFVSDVDPDLARRTRDRVADELRTQGIEATAAHFPEMRFGRLIEKERTWIS